MRTAHLQPSSGRHGTMLLGQVQIATVLRYRNDSKRGVYLVQDVQLSQPPTCYFCLPYVLWPCLAVFLFVVSFAPLSYTDLAASLPFFFRFREPIAVAARTSSTVLPVARVPRPARFTARSSSLVFVPDRFCFESKGQTPLRTYNR